MVNPAQSPTSVAAALTSDGILADAGQVTVTLPPSIRPLAAVAPAGLASVEAELLAGETDRGALADALHDGAVQALVSARWAIDAGDPALAREAVQAALVELRHTLWQLRPRGGDLAAALDQLARRPDVVRPLTLDLDRGASVRPAAAALVYRLVQHLAALPGGPLRVTLTERPDGVVLDLSDTPPPADPWPARVAALGGRVVTLQPDPRTDSPCDLRLILPHARLTAKAPS